MNEVESLQIKVMSKVIKDKKGCWLWKGKLDPNGYARFFHRNQRWLLHRAAFRCFKVEIPPHTMICHTCHVRNCVNPNHLYAGSHQENMGDMKKAGRACQGRNHPIRKDPTIVKHGEDCHFAKLTANQVIMIRELYNLHPNCCSIARITRINRKTISDIVARKCWRHMDEDN